MTKTTESSGFKGRLVGVSNVEISGSFLIADFQFVDSEGMVHATTRHRIPLAEADNPKVNRIRETASNLLEELVEFARIEHFEEPIRTERNAVEEAIGGISESLEKGDDEPG